MRVRIQNVKMELGRKQNDNHSGFNLDDPFLARLIWPLRFKTIVQFNSTMNQFYLKYVSFNPIPAEQCYGLPAPPESTCNPRGKGTSKGTQGFPQTRRRMSYKTYRFPDSPAHPSCHRSHLAYRTGTHCWYTSRWSTNRSLWDKQVPDRQTASGSHTWSAPMTVTIWRWSSRWRIEHIYPTSCWVDLPPKNLK